MPYALSNSKISTASSTASIKRQAQWIHLIRGPGGNEFGSKRLGGFEHYLPRDDFAFRSTAGEKS
ncbi:MAG: hypothetical protein B7X71_07120 [Polynucleobacter sp. 39-46-10]|nr:MAG: hypothetical protein B7X71_07120 [Polynucleobacter sp. 39-46-10]